MIATNTFHNSSIRPIQPIRSRQQLIVQINIGKKGQTNQIRLTDLSNSNYIDCQIKTFIKNHSLKQTAFSYIKEIISKQISQKKEEIYQKSHSKCTKNCKCEKKMNVFQEKQKKILGVITLNSSKNNESRSIQSKPKVQHLSIKITPKQNAAKTKKQQQPTSSAFNSSFLSTQKSKIISLVQTNNQLILQSNKPIESQKQLQQQALIPKSNYVSRQNLSIKNLQASLNKNSIQGRNTNYQSSISLQESQSYRKSKVISTRERKQAIMTPKKIRLVESQAYSNIGHSQQKLQMTAAEHKSNLKEQNIKIIKKILQSPLFPNKCLPSSYQCVIEALFSKLTNKNPPQIKEIHSQYVSYQQLQKEQLQFMGVLFQKLNHLDLNNLNYGNFRSNSLKYCWKQLEQLVESKKTQGVSNNI